MSRGGDQHWTSRRELEAEEFRSHVQLLAALGKGLHASGLPSHRLETMLHDISARLETPAQVFSLPTGLIVSVGEETSPTTMLLRAESTAVHLERLARLYAVARGIARGALEAPEAKRRIDYVMRTQDSWGWPAIILAYVLSAGAFAVFFGGKVPEIATAILVGFAVGLIALAMQLLRSRTRVFELSAAAAAATIANVAAIYIQDFVEWIPLASGLIILLPGFSLVDALDELAHGHLASGGARLAGAGVVLLAMGFGTVIGLTLVSTELILPAPIRPHEPPDWWAAPALVAVAAGSMIRFRARWRNYWAALVGSTIALVGARLGAYYLGPHAGPFLAALLLGAGANIFAMILRQPAQLMAVPGLALLVPGSFGVRSLEALLSANTTLGVETAFQMFLTGMALVAGLLISNSFFRGGLDD